MKVVITGGGGFLGQRLARRLLQLGRLTSIDGERHEIDELALFDVTVPASAREDFGPRGTFVIGGIDDRAAVQSLFDRPDIAVFHLASVVSSGAEQDFDLAIRVNLQGTLNVLQAARALGSRPRVVFASSIAVFGGQAMPARVGDDTKQVPQTTYGMTKVMGELLINDYTRKGFIDGRSARLPTVIVRPGKPNKAASSFASGIFREPLNGETCSLPVRPETRMPVAGYRTVVEGLVRLHEIDGQKLGSDRALNFPSLTVSVTEMIEALNRTAGERKLGPIEFAPDPAIERIVAGWPSEADFRRAVEIGLPSDPDLDSILRAYIADYLSG